jgi:hypothetical protein
MLNVTRHIDTTVHDYVRLWRTKKSCRS